MWETPIIINNPDENLEDTSGSQTISEDQSSQVPSSINSAGSSGINDHQKRLLSEKQLKNVTKKRKTDALEKTISGAFTTLESFFKNNPEEDEDGLFAQSIAMSLRKIKNRRHKARAKIEILEVLGNYDSDN